MGTSVERSTAQTDFVLKARAHGIAGERVDGMDVLAVRDVAQRVIRRIRETGEPYFLDLVCYRYAGHGMADNPQQQRLYRTEEEIAEWRKKDPIPRLGNALLARGLMTEEEAEVIEAEIKAEIEEAIEFAEASPEPRLDALYEHVYS
jgi:TPP-dependent pyruvate/acetoin dehydrogenase alpha subunit